MTSRLAEIAQCLHLRADKYLCGPQPMPNTARALRADAALLSLGAAVVEAARVWRRCHRRPISAGLLVAVDAYEAALAAEDNAP